MPIRLAFALSVLAVSAWAEPKLIEVNRFDLHDTSPLFGGLSGLEVDATGMTGWAINDRARMFPLTFSRKPNGDLQGVGIRGPKSLRMPVADRIIDAKADTEGLVVMPNGRVFISLESPSRIWALSEDWRTLYSFGLGDTLDAYLEPTGLEALALDPQSRLVAIPEWPVHRKDTTFPVLRQTNEHEGWEVAAKLPRRGSFKPVGADFDAKGRLYLLERAVSLLGFRSRIRRFDLSAKDLNEETLLTTKLGTYDNLEAIALWESDRKGVRIIVLSDDNLWHLQRTELIEFLLTE